MSKTVEFLFDVGSPYSYLAYRHLPTIAQASGASIVWTPVLLGGIFQATGNRSPAETPAKREHLETDLQRWARAYNTHYASNPHFPINTLMLMRGAVALQMRDETQFQRYLAAVFEAMFGQPENLGDPQVLGRVLMREGFDPTELLALTQSQAVKDQLKRNTEEAIARGAFGAPTFFVGDDMFWGQDRLHFVEAALQ
jgi:2-hydroxychromene-2-carboxylate isomerase